MSEKSFFNTNEQSSTSTTEQEERDRQEAWRRAENFKRRKEAKALGIPFVPLEEESGRIPETSALLSTEKVIEHIPLLSTGLKHVGTIVLPETEVRQKKMIKNFFESPEALTAIKEKLSNVYTNRPDLKTFINGVKGKYAELYTEESVNEDIKYVEMNRSLITIGNERYGESLTAKHEAGFEHGEILQAIIIDQINNNNWLPDMKGIMTSDYDDLKVGIDCALRYEKDTYFGTSFDMTISEKEEVVEAKMQKNWDRYITKGKIPTLKYFEDPDNHEIKGRRSLPKFVIGGSRDDLESILTAYSNNDFESIANHSLKYTIIAQIDAQLTRDWEFYHAEENKDKQEFTFAREQYDRFKAVFDDIKRAVNFDEKIQEEVNASHLSKNTIYSVAKNFTPHTEEKVAA
jgi:hypothetical protein